MDDPWINGSITDCAYRAELILGTWQIVYLLGNSVVTDIQFGHLFLVCIKYDALQEVTCGLFRKISHCS